MRVEIDHRPVTTDTYRRWVVVADQASMENPYAEVTRSRCESSSRISRSATML